MEKTYDCRDRHKLLVSATLLLELLQKHTILTKTHSTLQSFFVFIFVNHKKETKSRKRMNEINCGGASVRARLMSVTFVKNVATLEYSTI